MIRQLWSAHRRGDDPAELHALAALLVRENTALRLQNAHLVAENHGLRRAVNDRGLRLLRRAERDAGLLAALHFAMQPTTREACLEYGISRRRWAWARALLKVAGLLADDGIAVTDFDDFDRLVAVAVERVERDGLHLLTMNLPRNGESGRKLRPRTSRPTSRGESRRTSRS